MERSETINELAAALSKAQAKMDFASRDSANPFFHSKYADLASVWGACRGPLTENGLSIVQSPSSDGPIVTVETLLLHTSGQWISCSLSASAAKPDAQSIGSAITYLRRYTLQSLVGVAPDDDDGNAASGNITSPAKQKKPERTEPVPLTAEDAKYIADAQQEIARCESEAELDLLASVIAGKSEAVRTALKPMGSAKRRELQTRQDGSP